jgi:hypothetical protein
MSTGNSNVPDEKNTVENNETKSTIHNYNKKIFIQSLIKENIGNEMIQSILKMFNTKYKLIKFFWFVCLSINVGCCSYLIIETLMGYFSYETYTSSKTYFETPSQFPMVTICKLKVCEKNKTF